jgi:transcriptional regulator with XRE-family HTH domain
MSQEWIAVSERLPEDGAEVLGFSQLSHAAGVYDYIDRMHFEGGRFLEFGDEDDYANDRVTHWMPLPAPPLDEQLKRDFTDPEYAAGYAESFMDSQIAAQLKVVREQRGMTQQQVAESIGTVQSAYSRLEDVNYCRWSLTTLKKLAAAYGFWLKVSFETYDTLPREVTNFSRESLQRPVAAPPLAPEPQEDTQFSLRCVTCGCAKGKREEVKICSFECVCHAASASPSSAPPHPCNGNYCDGNCGHQSCPNRRATPERKERQGERRKLDSCKCQRGLAHPQALMQIGNDDRSGRDRRQSVGPEEE